MAKEEKTEVKEILSMDLIEDDEVKELVDKYNDLTERMSAINVLKKEREGIRDKLLEILGEANEGITEKWVIERSSITRKAFSVEEKVIEKIKIKERT